MHKVSKYVTVCVITMLAGTYFNIAILAALGASFIAPVYLIGVLLVGEPSKGEKMSLSSSRVLTDLAVVLSACFTGVAFNSFAYFLLAALPVLVFIRQALKN